MTGLAAAGGPPAPPHARRFRPLSLLGSLLCIGAFWAKSRVFETFADTQGYYLYHFYFFEERELAFFLWFCATLLPAALLMARFLEGVARGDLLARLLTGSEISDARFAWLLAGVAVALATTQALVTLELSPITDDERVYRFMAQLLLQGRAQYPTPSEELFPFLFKAFMNFEHGRWTAIYLWGHPAFLAPGEAVGFPQLMNLLSAGVSVLCTFHIARTLFDSLTARVAGVLMVLSPLFIFSASTMLSQPSGAMFLAVGGLAYVKLLRGAGRGRGWALLCGLALSWAFYCRPASAALIGFICVHGAVCLVTSRGRLLLRAWPMVIGAAVPIVVFGGINLSLDGHLLMPMRSHDSPDTPGLGIGTVVGGVRFGPLLAVSNVADNLLKLNLWGLGWPVSLFPAALALLCRAHRRAVLTLAAAAVCHVVVMGLYWGTGIGDLTPTYHLPLMPVLAVLGARGLIWGRAQLQGDGGAPGRALARHWVALAGALCLVATPTAWVIQAASLEAVQARVQAPYRMLERAGVESNALVFYRAPSPRVSWVLNGRISTPPWDAPVVYLMDRGLKADRELARRRFPKRAAYRVASGAGYWVLQRLSDGELIEVGPHVWGDRRDYPYRNAYPYTVFKDVDGGGPGGEQE